MKTYSDFVKIFRWLKNSGEAYDLPMETIHEKAKLYERMNAKTPEEQKELRDVRTKLMNAYIEAGIADSHCFEIEEAEKRLLLLTDSPKSKDLLRESRMPFPSTFIDMEILRDELPEYVKKNEPNVEKIFGLLVMEMNVTEAGEFLITKDFPEQHKIVGRKYYLAFGVSHTKNGLPYTSVYDLIIPIEDYDEEEEHETQRVYYDKRGRAILQYFRTLIINFGLFINHPEVETITVNRSQHNTARRLRQHKIPLPSSQKIRLTGKVKRYIDQFRTELEGIGFDHRFWVRGHWRWHRSDRYKTMKGRVIWISPFIKGRGELIDKTYLLEAGESA